MAFRRVLKRTALVLLGLVVVLTAAHVSWTYVEKAAFETRIERIREAGDPVYPTDLARPPIPDEQNAAKLLEEAAAWLDRRREQEDNLEEWLGVSESLREDWTPEEREQLHAYLDSVQPYFELIEQIPKRPQWRLDLEWADGLAMAVPALEWTMDAVHYTRARVELDRVEEGRTERAARAVIFLLGCADRCRLPGVMGYVWQVTIWSRAVDVLGAAAGKPGFDAALFRRLVDARLSSAIPSAGPPADVLREERALMLWVVRAWLAGESVTVDDGLQRFPLCRPFLYRDAIRMLDVYEQAIVACATTPERASAVAARLRPAKEEVGLSNLARPLYVVPGRLFEQQVSIVAALRLARVVMALLEHRQVHGAWPEDLGALGNMPLDPYSGAPFRYTRTDKGTRIHAACPEKDGWTLEERDLAWSWEK